MKIVIDKEAIIKAFTIALYAVTGGDYSDVKDAVKEVLEKIDYEPYEERPCGKWIVGEYMDCHSDILPQYTCPFCGEVAYSKYDFCHCGADMRKEEV